MSLNVFPSPRKESWFGAIRTTLPYCLWRLGTSVLSAPFQVDRARGQTVSALDFGPGKRLRGPRYAL